MALPLFRGRNRKKNTIMINAAARVTPSAFNIIASSPIAEYSFLKLEKYLLLINCLKVGRKNSKNKF